MIGPFQSLPFSIVPLAHTELLHKTGRYIAVHRLRIEAALTGSTVEDIAHQMRTRWRPRQHPSPADGSPADGSQVDSRQADGSRQRTGRFSTFCPVWIETLVFADENRCSGFPFAASLTYYPVPATPCLFPSLLRH